MSCVITYIASPMLKKFDYKTHIKHAEKENKPKFVYENLDMGFHFGDFLICTKKNKREKVKMGRWVF